MRKFRFIAVLLVVCGMITAYYTVPRSLGFGETTVAEVEKTGYFKLSCYEPDIDWDKQVCYPGTDISIELTPSEMQEILDCLPDLKGRRRAPFEWKPEGLNTRYPAPVYMKVDYGGLVDEHWAQWVFRCYFVQKDNRYTVILQARDWYELTDADEFIQTVLRHYPGRDIWIPEIRLPRIT